MALSADKFRAVMRNYATGVTVVTTQGVGGSPYGVTVTAFTSLSLDPLMVLVCLDRKLSGLELFEDFGRMGVNILAEGQEAASVFFSQPSTDRSEFDYVQGENGLPLLADCLAWLECNIVESFPGGDHKILVGQVTNAVLRSDRRPLLYYDGAYAQLAD